MRRQLILAALASQYWAMEPKYLATMSNVLQRWSLGAPATPEVMEDVQAAQSARATRQKAAANVGGGIAVLTMYGVISQRASMADDISGSGGTSTQKFTQAFRDAMTDDTIGGIIIDIDSPGGSVFGVQDLYSEIMAARGVKPVFGIANSLCASAAFWLGSACQSLFVAPGGQVGSVGVYMQHVDATGAMAQDGLVSTFISAGKYKVEGNSYEKLSDEALAFMQSQVDAYYSAFTTAIAKSRGVSISAVRDGMGQGRCLLDSDAVAAGMCDAVDNFDGVVKRMGKAMRSSRGTSASLESESPVAEEELGVIVNEVAIEPVIASIEHRIAARNREIELLAT